MSLKQFEKAYTNSDIKTLREYIRNPKVIKSTRKFMALVEHSFMTNQKVYDVLVLILFNQYDLNKTVKIMIDMDNVDLLENILSNDVDIKLDEDLIQYTLPKGRISMAKAIYEFIHGVTDSYKIVKKILQHYDFVSNWSEKSVDTFVLALFKRECEYAEQSIPFINPNFWNDFAIKYATEQEIFAIVDILLCHNMIDPGVDDNFPLMTAINKNYYHIASKLLRHPLVGIDMIDLGFISYIVDCNHLYIAGKIFHSKNNDIISLFEHPVIIRKMISYGNDVTYLAVRMGIIDPGNEEFEQRCMTTIENRQYLQYYIDNYSYIEKPYSLVYDPCDIYEEAIMSNNIDLAKSIINYPVSVEMTCLLGTLMIDENYYSNDYDSSDDDYGESVCDYIWNNIIIKYNPNDILWVSSLYNIELIDSVLNIVKNHPKLEYEVVYDQCEIRGDEFDFVENYLKELMWKKIRDTYSKKKYRKFLQCETEIISDDITKLEKVLKNTYSWK